MYPSKDFESIISEMGSTLELKSESFTDSDPIYGSGSATTTVATVDGFFDYYNVAQEVLGFGELLVGDCRVFIPGYSTVSPNDKIVSSQGTYSIQEIKELNYKGGTPYKIVEVIKD